MIKNKLITLRCVLESDIGFLIELRNNIKLQEMLIARARPNDIIKAKQWVRSRVDDESKELFIISNTKDNSPMGFIQLTNIEFINRTCELGVCIDPKHQGKGLFILSLDLLTGYLVNILNLRKIIVFIRADNVFSVKAFLKAGFYEVGTLRDHIVFNNCFFDVKIMEKSIV